MAAHMDRYREPLLKDLSALIAIPSLMDTSDPEHPFGKENTKALDHMLALGKQHGFNTVNLDNKVGYVEYGEGEEYIAVLTHLDVVPVGDGWSQNPFGGDIVDGKLYGRGVLDDKGPAMAAFYALVDLKEKGLKPKHRIRLIMGLNEENGSKCIAHYKALEKPPVAGFTPDADFPVVFAEKGILGLEIKKAFAPPLQDGGLQILWIRGGVAGNMVPGSCEAELTGRVDFEHILKTYNETYGEHITMSSEGNKIHLIAKGKSAHASTPENGINAISHMMRFLDCLDLAIGDAANFVRGYVRRIGLETDGEHLGTKCADDVSGSLTCNVGIVEMDEKMGRLVLNLRYPVTVTLETVMGESYKQAIAEEGWEAAIAGHSMPLYKEPDSPLVKQLMDVYYKHTGDTAAKPLTMGGGTYARSLPNVVAFGALLPHMPDTMHQADECCAIDDLMTIAEIIREAMLVLACEQ